jgi:hypothetical protein
MQKTREESFCSPVFTDFSSSEKHQKDADEGHPLTKLTRGLPRVGETKETCLLGQSWGGYTMIAPSIYLSPIFAYKCRGDEESKRREHKRGGRPKEKKKERELK